jgi:hypothetical protein
MTLIDKSCFKEHFLSIVSSSDVISVWTGMTETLDLPKFFKEDKKNIHDKAHNQMLQNTQSAKLLFYQRLAEDIG